MKMIMLMMLVMTVAGADFVKNGETVRDSKSGLLWQDNDAVENREVLFGEAKAFCQQLVLAGHEDWRMPTLQELQTIIDLKRYDPALQRGFHFGASKSYWSSTLFADDPDRAWDVDFKSGATEHNRHSYDFYVRCVRNSKTGK